MCKSEVGWSNLCYPEEAPKGGPTVEGFDGTWSRWCWGSRVPLIMPGASDIDSIVGYPAASCRPWLLWINMIGPSRLVLPWETTCTTVIDEKWLTSMDNRNWSVSTVFIVLNFQRTTFKKHLPKKCNSPGCEKSWDPAHDTLGTATQTSFWTLSAPKNPRRIET